MTDARNRSLVRSMGRSHTHLAAICTRLLAAMEADAPDVRALWRELDYGLLAHMESEERFLLPKFAHVDKAEALALLREHGAFRELLFELGIAVDLHHLRYAQSKELVDALERHAEREERLLYRWADEQLDGSVAEMIRTRVDPPSPRPDRAV